MTEKFKTELINVGVDFDTALDRCMNDENLFEILLKMFIKDSNYELLIKHIEEENDEDAFSCAHTLKGISSNIGLDNILKYLIPMVADLRAHNISNAKLYLDGFKEQYNLIHRIISQNSK